ncbi:MAG: hypothetical protein DK841_02655 [Candidatus Melainabacteria bacterium]|nr:MAG: hypothetical protein DK841_02655 [Candidatus Melainabacteria bacterium]
MTMNYEEVKKDFLSGKIKGCKTYFENNNYYVEAGYCCIVLDELDKAKELFQKVQEVDTRAKWGLILLQMIKGDILTFPTYFQIRNFLELDLSILILYCKGEYVEKIIRYADFMAYYNPECYKFIGRAFWANNLMSAAMFFLRRAKDKFYQDPELHYLLAYIFYNNDRNIDLAKKALGACLGILPEYAPAKKLYAQIVQG